MSRRAWKLIVRQLRNYPVGLDDILDCTGYHKDVRRFRRPGKAAKPKTEEDEKLDEMRRNERNYARDNLDSRRGRKRLEIVGGLASFM